MKINIDGFQGINSPGRKVLVGVHGLHKVVNKGDKGSVHDTFPNLPHKSKLIRNVVDRYEIASDSLHRGDTVEISSSVALAS